MGSCVRMWEAVLDWEIHFCFSLAFRKEAKMSRHSLFPMRLLFLFRVRLVLCLPDTKNHTKKCWSSYNQVYWTNRPQNIFYWKKNHTPISSTTLVLWLHPPEKWGDLSSPHEPKIKSSRRFVFVELLYIYSKCHILNTVSWLFESCCAYLKNNLLVCVEF